MPPQKERCGYGRVNRQTGNGSRGRCGDRACGDLQPDPEIGSGCLRFVPDQPRCRGHCRDRWPFTLTDENGNRVTDKEVLAKPALVYFGYTYCPDVCPTDVGRNAEAIDILEERGHEVTPVFISVDPRRDTPEVLKEWTDYLHPRMIGLTGTPQELKTVAQEYKTFFQVPDNPADDTYLVDHMTQTYQTLPALVFVEFFSREETPDSIAEPTPCFIDAANETKSTGAFVAPRFTGSARPDARMTNDRW